MGEVRTLADLRQDSMNARRHNPRNVSLIVDALHEVGAARSGVIDEDGRILAGNATFEALAEAGIERVRVVETDGQEWVVVRRSGLSEEAKRRLALYDNRTAELADWDPEVLAGLDTDGLLDGLWGAEELAELLADFAPEPPPDPGAQMDRAAELQEKWRVERGQVWEVPSKATVGKCHRVMCGDSTSEEDVGRLMGECVPNLTVTDPPYGVEYDAAWRRDVAVGEEKEKAINIGRVTNDEQADWGAAWLLVPGPVLYVWHSALFAGLVERSLAASGFHVRSQIIWRKSHFAMSRGHYHWQHEPCFYTVRKGATANWIGDRKQTTVWDILPMHAYVSEEEHTGHGTQKPVECMARPIRNHEGDVYDPFLGSGTTLVAAEQVGRLGYGMEISPPYVAVTLERLTGLGLEPRLADLHGSD